MNIYTEIRFPTFGARTPIGIRFAGGLISAPADKLESGLTSGETGEWRSFSPDRTRWAACGCVSNRNPFRATGFTRSCELPGKIRH